VILKILKPDLLSAYRTRTVSAEAEIVRMSEDNGLGDCAGLHRNQCIARIERKLRMPSLKELQTEELLEAARSGDLVEAELADGADVDMKTKGRSHTALMLAAHGGHAAVVADLFKAGARIGLRNKHGTNAREIAVERCHRECARLLKKPFESMLALSDAQIKKMKLGSLRLLLKEFSIPCKGCQKSEYVKRVIWFRR